MYIGRYYHRLEAKGRVSLPVKFRDKVQKGAIITKELDGCLSIFDEATWEKRIARLEGLEPTKKAHRDYIRFVTNDAQELEIDSQGRIRIDESLQTRAGLTKEIVFVGSKDHIEVWDQARYHKYMEEVESRIETEVETIETP